MDEPKVGDWIEIAHDQWANFNRSRDLPRGVYQIEWIDGRTIKLAGKQQTFSMAWLEPHPNEAIVVKQIYPGFVENQQTTCGECGRRQAWNDYLCVSCRDGTKLLY